MKHEMQENSGFTHREADEWSSLLALMLTIEDTTKAFENNSHPQCQVRSLL